MRLFVAALAALALAPSPARAECIFLPPPPVAPFDGQRVPQAAELRFTAVAFVNDAATVVFPDAREERVAIIHDDISDLLALPEPRAIGPYRVRFSNVELTFTLTNDGGGETTLAAPSVIASQSTAFNPPALPFTECPVEPGFKDNVRLDVSGTPGARLVLVDGKLAGTAEDDGFASVAFREPRSGAVTYTVAVRNFVGQQSEGVEARVYGGCEGCATTGASSPFAALFVVLGARTSSWTRARRRSEK